MSQENYDVSVPCTNPELKKYYFYGRRQGNGCEIQFRGLLYAREVLISRTVAHKFFFTLPLLHKKALKIEITYIYQISKHVDLK
jgi:hypothetical protein